MTEAEESERRQKEFADAHPALHRGARCRRDAGAVAGLGRLRHGRGSRLCRSAARLPRSKGSTSRRRRNCRRGRANISTGSPAEQDASRKELGVDDALGEVEGVTPAMLVALGEAGIKTVEDLAGCATDDLIGWTERKESETVKHKGAFSRLDVSAAEAEAHDHGGARQGRLDRGAGGSRRPAEEPAAGGGAGRLRTRARMTEADEALSGTHVHRDARGHGRGRSSSASCAAPDGEVVARSRAASCRGAACG